MPLFPKPVSSGGDFSTAGAFTAVPAAVNAPALLAANSARKAATIINNSTATLSISLGSDATANHYTVQLGNGDYYEVPGKFTGVVSGIWSAANGNAFITELT